MDRQKKVDRRKKTCTNNLMFDQSTVDRQKTCTNIWTDRKKWTDGKKHVQNQAQTNKNMYKFTDKHNVGRTE